MMVQVGQICSIKWVGGGGSSHLHGQTSDRIGLRLQFGVCWGAGDDCSIGEVRKIALGAGWGCAPKREEEQQILI